MTNSNYIPTFDNHLFQNYDNQYIIYYQYDNRIYVFRSNNRLNNNNNRNNTTTTTRPDSNRIINYDNNRNRIVNYDNNRNDTITNDYIRNY